jgi:WD40 repeat protein
MRVVVIFLFCFALCGAVRADEQARGWLGAAVDDVSAKDAAKLGMETPHGVIVTRRDAGTPAEKAGLETGDVILGLDRTLVDNKAGFEADVAAKAPGTEIKLLVRRGAREKGLSVALAAEPKPVLAVEGRPILQLDTGGHRAVIRDLAFTPDGKFIVSAGDDKVIRVWDWRKGVTVRTIRGQSGLGDQGKIYAMALSSDGRWLAASGHFDAVCPGQCEVIRLYDFATGELKALLSGHRDKAVSLAFSPDGTKLISGSGDTSAIIWDVETGTPLHRLQGHPDFIYAVGFTPDGARAVTASYDTLRLWRVADGVLIKEMKRPLMSNEIRAPGVVWVSSDEIRALAISPSGAIASGDAGGKIWLWDGMTGEFQRVLADQRFAVSSLRFSPDGTLLLSAAGSTGYCGNCGWVEHVWNVATGREVAAYAKQEENVFASSYSPQDGLVATGGLNGDIHVWDPKTGETKAVQKGTGRSVRAVGFSADGRSIAWGGKRELEEDLALFDLPVAPAGPLERAFHLPQPGQTLSAPQPLGSGGTWVRPDIRSVAISFQHRKDDAVAILELKKPDSSSPTSIELNPSLVENFRCFVFSPDGKSVIAGGNQGILAGYGLDSKKLGDFVGHESTVFAVAVSLDGRYLVSGSADQTVRLWNLRTRELIVTIFRGENGEWVIWTPQGYYTGSPGADKIIGWQINKGPNKAADYVTAEQLRKYLNRPDIVAKAIQLASAQEAVRTSYGTEFKLSDLLARPAPQLHVLSPTPGVSVTAPGRVAVGIALSATPDPVTRIRIQVNGRQLDDFLPPTGPKFEPGEHEFSVPLAKGKNTIVVTALNEIGWSKVQDGTVTLTNDSAGELDKRGTLYILAVGVTKYPGIAEWCRPKKTCDLNYTGQDALAFAEVAERQLGPLHNRTVRRVLVNGGSDADTPTAAHIIDALSILSDARANDTVAVFLAGHGINDGPNYRFISTDAAGTGGKIRASSIVSWYAIEEAIDQAKGRRLLFIDTCHSAGAYNERLGNTAYYANILVYSSARWDQEALESAEYKHGLFTQALLEALNGEADTTHQGRVDTLQLNEYLQKRVPELAKAFKYDQNPQFFKGRDAEIYTLALVR